MVASSTQPPNSQTKDMIKANRQLATAFQTLMASLASCTKDLYDMQYIWHQTVLYASRF
jgi:hypothetical protein